ncbi:MAG: 30S ribosomal protein S12 methylthiotransferase RimO [Planctomycetaceae bacterium]|nr:30S ribosomal protein S12 methylthiotransferase RimO [Planctomycetaceae bacterium]
MPFIKPDTFSILSLGCPKNLVDSEHYAADFSALGKTFQPDIDDCETVILNTCGFLQSARDEARDYIRSLIQLKREGHISRIVVRGCMPQYEVISKLAAEFPEIDEWSGVREMENDTNVIPAESISSPLPAARHRLTEKHVAYLRIADGCDRRCTFCAIPNIRGRFRSEPLEKLLDEAAQLVDGGVKEIVVIAQETTFWGNDLYGKPQLPALLRKLEEIDSLRWIRVMYAYPQYFDDELIDLFAAKRKLLPYIDIPLQHADNDILRRMNRRVTLEETELLLGELRERIENLVLRTSLIVGFPGETDEMFSELVRFTERWKFERAGVFQFSPEKGTPAAQFSDKVSAPILQRRFDKLYRVCERYSTAWAAKQKGRIINVQIDGNYIDKETGRTEPNLFIGRTYADAPDVDPVVYVTVQEGGTCAAGSIVPCEILETEGCDLVGITTQ